MRSAITSVLTTVAVVAGFLVASATPSTAAPVAVGLSGYVDMAVDEAHGNVLIASGSSSSELTVLGLDGTSRAPITGMASAQDIQLSSDGSTFHVALENQRAIGLVDSATLEVTKRSLGAGVCPTSVAEEGGVLWFTYTDCAGSGADLGSLQISDDTVTLALAPGGLAPSRVQASPGLPGRLVVRTYDTLTILDVSGGPTTTPAAGPSAATDGRDFAITPDGLEVISTDYGAGYRHVGFSTADMTEQTIYPTDAYPDAVAVRDDGMVAAGIDASYGQDLFIFHRGSSSLYRSYDVEDRNASVARRGLEFGATDLYVVSDEWYSGQWVYTFQRITPRLASSMTLTRGAAVYPYGATAKITVKLSVPGGAVKVYATPYGGTRKLLRATAVDATGRLVVTTPVKVRTTFSVYYAGDAGHDPVSRATTVAVRASVTQSATRVVGTSGSYRLVRSGTAPRVYGTVRPYHVGQCVRFQIQQPSSTGWGYTQTSGCIRLNSYSKTYVYFDRSWKPRDRLRVRTMWGGDTRNAARYSTWMYLKFVS